MQEDGYVVFSYEVLVIIDTALICGSNIIDELAFQKKKQRRARPFRVGRTNVFAEDASRTTCRLSSIKNSL
jgi:hypothetical protein